MVLCGSSSAPDGVPWDGLLPDGALWDDLMPYGGPWDGFMPDGALDSALKGVL